jgi:hypothetical protein
MNFVPGLIATSVSMLRYSPRLLVVILISLFAAALNAQSNRDDISDRVYQVPARLLYVGDGRSYFLVEAPFEINSDFRVQYTNTKNGFTDCPIADVAGQIAISAPVTPDQLPRRLQEDSLNAIVYLDTTRVTSRVIRVGQLSEFSTDNLPLQSNRVYVFENPPYAINNLPVVGEQTYYRKMRDAEIDLAVGKIDILILPENEIPSDAACLYQVIHTGSHVEWYLLSSLPDNDLNACALNYCLKYEFSNDTTELPSLMLDTTLINKGFPRDSEKARALFEQIKPVHNARWCGFDAAMFPQTANRVSKRLQECGGKFNCDNNLSTMNGDIMLVASLQPGGDSLDQLLAEEHQNLLYRNHGFFDFRHVALPDSCLSQNWHACESQFPDWISRECRFIPLGRIEMIALVRRDIHRITDRQGHFSVTHFYRGRTE